MYLHNVSLTTSPTVLSANWERNDSTGYSSIGTGMAESSGIFTFPQTGIYLIKFFGTSSYLLVHCVSHRF